MTKKLTSFSQQEHNANRHTERGMRLLEKSIQEDGWIGAITAAADGEIFDGSARHEVGTATGFDDAIVIESDGSRPVIVKRMDIPNASHPRAKKLGLAANRIAQLNLDYEPAVLTALAGELDLSPFFTELEFADVAMVDLTIPDPQPQQEPQLKAECFIEIYCADADLEDFRPALDEWARRKSVTVNIS